MDSNRPSLNIATHPTSDGFPDLRLHTPEEGAELLRCTASWLREKARKREIPHVLVSGRYRFTDQHLAEIVATFERRPTLATVPSTSSRPVRRAKTSRTPSGITVLAARTPRRRSA